MDVTVVLVCGWRYDGVVDSAVANVTQSSSLSLSLSLSLSMSLSLKLSSSSSSCTCMTSYQVRPFHDYTICLPIF